MVSASSFGKVVLALDYKGNGQRTGYTLKIKHLFKEHKVIVTLSSLNEKKLEKKKFGEIQTRQKMHIKCYVPKRKRNNPLNREKDGSSLSHTHTHAHTHALHLLAKFLQKMPAYNSTIASYLH